MEDSNDLSAGALHAGHTSETEFGEPSLFGVVEVLAIDIIFRLDENKTSTI